MKVWFIITSVLILLSLAEGKKKKKSTKKESLFDSKNLNCLVCKALVEEIEAAVNKVDPAKKS